MSVRGEASEREDSDAKPAKENPQVEQADGDKADEEAEEEDAEPDDVPEQIDATEDAPPESLAGEAPLQDVLINEEAENQKANRLLRATYADKAHGLAAGCIQFWALLISANGIIYAITDKRMISDTALIAITTGVTINVLAAFLGVIRGLFPSESPKKSEKKKTAKADKK